MNLISVPGGRNVGQSTPATRFWEKEKRQRSTRRVLRFFAAVFILVISASVLVKAPQIYRDFNSPLPRFFGDEEQSAQLDPSYRTNFLLFSYEKKAGSKEDFGKLTDAAVVSYEPVDKRITALYLNLPQNDILRRKVNDAFGQRGVVGLKIFLGNYFSVILDRYLAFEGSLTFDQKVVMDSFRLLKGPSVIFKLIPLKRSLQNTMYTNVSTTEALKVVWRLQDAKFEEKDKVSLELPLEQRANADTSLANLFLDRRVAEEQATVVVRNSSGVSGLGEILASYIQNLGASVLTVESGDEIVSESLQVTREEKLALQKRLSSLISLERKGAKEEFTGDILIIIGSKDVKRLTLE